MVAVALGSRLTSTNSTPSHWKTQPSPVVLNCNGGSCHSKVVVTIAETYAACVEQPIHRLAWAITAGINYIALGCNVSNAFAEPSILFFMEVDAQFLDWWVNCLGYDPLPVRWVMLILCNLEGHPEAPQLWHKHIYFILVNNLGSNHTTHKEPGPYLKHHPEHDLILFILQQVDDF
jgi:hypothetical protein